MANKQSASAVDFVTLCQDHGVVRESNAALYISFLSRHCDTASDPSVDGPPVDRSSVALIPKAFFLAWSGVITLAYEQFPSPLQVLKNTLTGSMSMIGGHLAKENFGTKWPKTSLGAIRDEHPTSKHDNDVPCSMSFRQYTRVLDLLDQCNAELIPQFQSETVDELHVVLYRNRALFSPIATVAIGVVHRESDPLSRDDPSKEIVEKVLAESDDRSSYFQAALTGTMSNCNRSGHYLQKCPPDLTLVAFLRNEHNRRLICEFQQRVDTMLAEEDTASERGSPYAWFPHESLHVSVRSLSPKADDETSR